MHRKLKFSGMLLRKTSVLKHVVTNCMFSNCMTHTAHMDLFQRDTFKAVLSQADLLKFFFNLFFLRFVCKYANIIIVYQYF